MSSSFRRRPPLAAWLGASVLAFAGTPAAGDPAPPFEDLLVQAQAGAPRLAEAAAEVRRAQGLARQAAVRPNPSAGVSVENLAASGRLRGDAAAEATFEVEQTFELGGKRAARITAGRAGVDAARARLAQTRADYAFELALAYGEAEAADRRIGLAQETLDLAEADLRAARALVDAGKEAELRTLQGDAAATAARAALSAARSARSAAYARLTALAGSEIPFTSLGGALLGKRAPGAPDMAFDPLAAPAVVAARAERDAAARRIRIEQARAVPDFTASVGVRRFNADDSTAMVAGISLPLPLFDRNRGNIGAAQAKLAAAEARLEAARLDALAGLAAARSEIEAARDREAAAGQGETTAREAYRLTRIAYESGKVSLVELNATRRALADARNQTLDAQLARLRAEAGLSRLQGCPPFGTAP